MKTRRIAAALLAAAAVFTAAVPKAMADDDPPAAAPTGNYTKVAGATTTFDKYLVMDEGTNVPDVTFNYTIAAGDHTDFDIDGKTIEVYAGLEPEKIIVTGETDGDVSQTTAAGDTECSFTIDYDPGDTTVLFAEKAATDYVKDLTDGEKYAKKSVTLNFQEVNFDEPGVFRYVITEAAPSINGIVYDTDKTRILDVYVIDKNGSLEVNSYILHATDETISMDSQTYGSDGKVISGKSDGASDPGVDTSDFKSQGFTNEYTSYDLTFGKEVTGNQASKDKYFEFTLELTGLPNAVYTVSYADDGNANTKDGSADAQIAANPNRATKKITSDVTQPDTITADADGKKTQVFYLHHGQSIVIRGLGEGTVYSVSEDPEDYTPSAEITGDMKTGDSEGEGTAITLINNAMADTWFKDDTDVEFTNTRNGSIPTGVLLSVAAPAIIGIGVLGGIIFLAVKRSRKDDDEDE